MLEERSFAIFAKIYLINPLTITLFGVSTFSTLFKWSCFALAVAISVRALKDRGSQIAKSANDFRSKKIEHLASPSLRVCNFIPCSSTAASILCSRN